MRFIDFINNYIDYTCSFAMIIITFVVGVNVAARYVFGFTFGGVEELTNYTFIAITFLGYSICIRDKMDMKVDVLEKKFSKTTGRWIKVLGLFIGFLFSIILFYLSIKHTIFVAEMGRISPSMRISMTIPYSFLIFGSLIIGLNYLVGIAKTIQTEW